MALTLLKQYALLAFLAIALFSIRFLSGGWVSDDYSCVYGLDGWGVPSFSDALIHLPSGHFTIHRWLLTPTVGYGGWLLGSHWAHLVAVLLHATVALLLWRLARMLGMRESFAKIAAVLFLVAPWSCQPPIWWTAVNTITSTAAFLLASMLYLGWLRGQRGSLSLISANLLVFLSISLYDLWLPGGLFLLALAWHQLPREKFSTVLWRASVMLPGFFLWLALYAAFGGPDSAVGTLAGSLHRMPIVFLSIQARCVQWFVGPDWVTLWKQGWEGLTSWHAAPLAGVLAGFWLLLRRVPTNDSLRRTAAQSFGRNLLLCYALFLSGRLLMLIVGGANLQGRHAYGASLAFALAVGFALEAWPSIASSKWVRAIGLAALLALVLATAGKARHLSEVSRYEHETVETAWKHLVAHPETKSLVVMGSPLPAHGELDYFNELDGKWLGFQLWRKGWRGEAKVYPAVPADKKPAIDNAATLIWENGVLRPL